jgi:hypothetical protein
MEVRWLALCPGRFAPRERATSYPSNRRLSILILGVLFLLPIVLPSDPFPAIFPTKIVYFRVPLKNW